MRVPVPSHLVGQSPSSLNVEGKVLVAGVSRGGGGFLPTADSTMQAGDFLVLMLPKDGVETMDQMLEAPSGDHA
jgi:hypothetical protein